MLKRLHACVSIYCRRDRHVIIDYDFVHLKDYLINLSETQAAALLPVQSQSIQKSEGVEMLAPISTFKHNICLTKL